MIFLLTRTVKNQLSFLAPDRVLVSWNYADEIGLNCFSGRLENEMEVKLFCKRF